MNMNPNNNYADSGNQFQGNHQQPQTNFNASPFSSPNTAPSNGNFVSQSPSIRANKIYIGNLNYELDTPDLKEAFSQFGEIIDVVVIKDKESGSSRGFGFVTFSAPNSARDALAMHGQELDGRRMRVKLAEAKPQPRQSPFIYTGDDEPGF